MTTLFSCTKKPAAEPRPISAREAMGMVSNDFAVLVDVREGASVKESGLATSAVWAPASKLDNDASAWKDLAASLPESKQIIFYGETEAAARRAAEHLAAQGFKTAYMPDFGEWLSEKLPIKKAD